MPGAILSLRSAGLYRILIEDKVFDAPVGISVTVPRGSRHSWRNISNETGRLLVYGWDS
jgi:mannose-6-phosphate isomerase-like protein (cupin superfamily)